MTKKAIVVAVVGLVLAIAAPSFAQGPFADVPVDHWAYEAVSQLQSDGIVIGYPDGTFSGKRAMTRYEFALALSRAIPVIADRAKSPSTPSGAPGVSKAEVQQMIDDNKPKPTNSADVDSLKKLVNEFKDELSGMGVDLDALKRDVASLEERVAAIEAEMKRLKITTKLNFFAVGDSVDMDKAATTYDKDSRPLAKDNNLLKNLAMVRDADIIFSYDAGGAKAKIVLNEGNYLNYLTGTLPNVTLNGEPRTMPGGKDYSDSMSLFLAYGEIPLLGSDFTVGRFPIQFTKWTLKKYDVDTYTENWKTDEGNYIIDGGKAAWTWGGVNVLAFAGKNNTLYNYDARPFDTSVGNFTVGNSLQSAGVHVGFGLGPAAKVGLTYISTGSSDTSVYDKADIWGADVDWQVSSVKINGNYTKSITSGTKQKVDKKNAAWDINADIGWLSAGYKEIGVNFSAPGDWARIGQWQNPVNIKGPEVGLKHAFGDRWALSAYGGWFKNKDTSGEIDTAGNPTGALTPFKVQQYKFGATFQTSEKGSLGLDGEWVRWDPQGAVRKAKESYYTLSYNHAVTDNTKLRLLYQIVDFKGEFAADDYKGDVAVAQVSMDF